ncbi:MAG: ATP-binding protein, partial [Chloroflexi bacterium]|nr:ATP-binding protein [Chloroflexota bacterium]
DGQGRIAGAVNVAQDITRRKSVEQLKDEFLSLAAHELKTPLTSVRGYSQLLLRRAARGQSGMSEQEMGLVQTIDERSRYMDRLINELLDVSRIETGRLALQLERLDLAALLRRGLDHQRALRPEARFQAAFGDEPLWGVWDGGRLEQVFTNLLDNAANYSPVGAAITVRLAVCGGEAKASVSDQGIGIPAADLPRLFERHYRASNVGPTPSGLGLGLYLTRQIVERHGGRITVASVEGCGSTFSVALPLAAE